MNEGQVHANGVDFTYLEEGSGPLALCLHGFPDSAHTWRYLLPALAEAGFHAVAPAMRGYAPTGPAADGRYQTGALVADANALHEALGGDGDAVIIGHDWGAMATYGAAAHQPDRWRRVVTGAVPPSAALGGAFLDYDQIKRSFYIWFFQLPLADMVVPMDDMRFIDRLWADWSPGYDATVDLKHVKEALGGPGSLEAAIGYYRAMFDPSRHDDALAAEQAATQAQTTQPTLYIHGGQDGCIGPAAADAAEAVMSPGSKVAVVDGTGHFFHVEKPDEVNQLIVEWVKG